MAETWRVVLASGEVREVRVSFEPYPGAVNDDPCQYVARCDDAEAESTASAHDAALWLASCHEWSAVEILAPGELTRAELRAQAWREGAEAMRSEARRLCDENVELVEGVLGMRPTDHLVLAAGDQGEIRGIRRIAREVHALPVPPCPEVSR